MVQKHGRTIILPGQANPFAKTTTNDNSSNLPALTGQERVMICVDGSGSMMSLWEGTVRAKAAAEATVAIIRKSSPAVSKIGLAVFSRDAKIVSKPTSAFSVLEKLAYQYFGDSTDYSVGIATCLQEDPNRIIFLSDGAPTCGDYDIRNIVQTCKDLKVKIDTIGIGETQDSKWLKYMADETGGIYTYCQTPEQLIAQFQQLETRERLRIEHHKES